MSFAMRTIVVVGDRFIGFSAQPDVWTVSQMSALMEEGMPTTIVPIAVTAGQGVCAEGWQALCEKAEEAGLADRLHFRFSEPALADRGEAHKHHEDNTLVANLRRTDQENYAADLRVHNDNELLLDHQTGQHVQGMVAVEAARQMFLAVSERHYASMHPERSYYYVIDTMNTTFENFLFPLDATVTLRMLSASVTDPTKMAFDAQIEVHQGGRRASVTTVGYLAFESAVIEHKEHKRAASAIAQVTAPVAEAAALLLPAA